MRLFNSLSRKTEEFTPINPPKVGMYTCGPTVYSYVTIGNWRTYMLGDLLLRTLKYLNYQPRYVMNLTDVGHLTGDNLGDADLGEDRLEKAAKTEGKTAWDIAKFYADDFYSGLAKLNLQTPDIFCKATDHIDDQISMIQKLEDKGFTYRIDDGIYFDIKSYEAAGNKYGELSTLAENRTGVRVEENIQKKDPRDFALWKFSPVSQKRQMEWDSPWGKGFPGWHIECSAMSQKYLGEQFDIHVGGEDLKSTHHPNEIAQAEGASGKKPFVKYWVHGAFLTVDGGRMGKSLHNAYKLQDLEAKGYTAIDLRYFYLTGNYRKQLNFTFEALTAAKTALKNLRDQLSRFRQDDNRVMLSPEKMGKVEAFRQKFVSGISEDLNIPQTLALAWEVVKSNIPNRDKYDLLVDFDQVWGLKLADSNLKIQTLNLENLPDEIKSLIHQREGLRQQGDYEGADKLRSLLEKKGYLVEDSQGGTTIKQL